MRIRSGDLTYEWMDDWASVPDSESRRAGWAHPGMVVTEGGDIITCHSGDPMVLIFDKNGRLKGSWKGDFTDAHGLTLVKEGGTEYLWIADNGSKRQPANGYDYPPGSDQKSGQVFKSTLDGKTVMRLEKPPHPVYQRTRYAPTSVAVNEERFGGNGDIWVADGYGASHVHHYDKRGKYIASINGEEGAGAFNCPHGIFIDRRKSEPELYVADRANARIQVYDLEDRFRRVFGPDFLTTPSAFVTHGGLMVIAELRARLAVTNLDDRLVGYLGANEEVCNVTGWPNNKNVEGKTVPTSLLQPGKFNSPHGLAVDAEGNLYVAEWLIGGRLVKLARA
jgi:hypothetical protein